LPANQFRCSIARKEFSMRALATLALISGLLASAAIAQTTQRPALQPTRLEAFATQPAARVIWSKEVGQINSSEARVIVTALIVEDETSPPNRMRGIRIDLANQKATDQVYIEEAKLEAIKKAIDEIAGRIESARRERSNTPLRYYGAAEFWRPGERVHTLNAAFYIAPDSSGLSLSAYNGQEFRFPNHSPSELAALIYRAIGELKQQG